MSYNPPLWLMVKQAKEDFDKSAGSGDIVRIDCPGSDIGSDYLGHRWLLHAVAYNLGGRRYSMKMSVAHWNDISATKLFFMTGRKGIAAATEMLYKKYVTTTDAA